MSDQSGIGAPLVFEMFGIRNDFLPRMAMQSAERGNSKVQEGAALFHLLDNGDGEAT